MNSLSNNYRPGVFADMIRTHRPAKFLLICSILIGAALLSMLAPVGSMAAKPLALDPEDAPFAAQACFSAITLEVEVLGADPMTRTLTLDWYPHIPSLDCADPSPVVFDLYMSHDILDTASPSWATMNSYPPLFQINSTNMCRTLSQLSPFPTFRTVTKLLVSSPQRSMVFPSRSQSSLQDYPFDVYIAPMILWLVDPETGIKTSPNITKTYGIAVNFEVSLPEASTTIYDSESQLLLTFRVERSIATKVFVVMVAITNWLTAVTFTIMSAAAAVYRPHSIYSEMFVLPVGMVFAFASIRQNMPGAPDGFGTTLDMYSTLPFLAIMTFAGLTLILLVLSRRIEDHYPSQKTLKAKVLDSEAIGDIGTKCCNQGRRFSYQAEPGQEEDTMQNVVPSARSMERISSSSNSNDATRVATPELDKQPAVKPISDEGQGGPEELPEEVIAQHNQPIEGAGLEIADHSGITEKIEVGAWVVAA